jgi:hypothetical protein
MVEEYKICFEKYEISNFGNCKKDGKIIKGSINNRGYRYFQVIRDGKRINNLFHHMVAYQFLGVRPDDLVIDHIDRNKLNNNVSNLRYISFQDNIKNCDRYRNDILETDKRLRGNILSQERYVRALHKNGKTVSYSKRGNGMIKQRSNKTWRAIIIVKKIKYDKTCDTFENAQLFISNVKNSLVI